MNGKLETMRKALRLVERRAAFALANQPEDETKCEDDLREVLKGIHATAELAINAGEAV